MITILGVPGVINKKIIICKKRIKSRGSIKKKIVLKNRELKMAKKDYQTIIYQVLKKMHYRFFLKYKGFMKKKGHRPITKVKNPEPSVESPDWVIWAAWADRITFEEIKKKTGYGESDVIRIMRRSLKPSSFRLWRKRVHEKSIKHRKKFEYSRKKISSKIKKGDYL